MNTSIRFHSIIANKAHEIAEEERRSITTPEKIVMVVSNYFGITKAQLRSKRRNQVLVIARRFYWQLIRDFIPETPLTTLGRYTGGRDHSTVINGLRGFRDSMETEPDMKEAYEYLKAAIANSKDEVVAKSNIETGQVIFDCVCEEFGLQQSDMRLPRLKQTENINMASMFYAALLREIVLSEWANINMQLSRTRHDNYARRLVNKLLDIFTMDREVRERYKILRDMIVAKTDKKVIGRDLLSGIIVEDQPKQREHFRDDAGYSYNGDLKRAMA